MTTTNWGKLYIEGDEDTINELCEIAKDRMIRGKIHVLDLRPELRKEEDD